MVSSKAKTITEYLKELPPDRRKEIKKVRDVIKKNLRPGFVETMNWGMISFEVPLETYPETYNGKPLSFIALASQKNNISLYLMCIYQDPDSLKELKSGFEKLKIKPNMGKSCVRFKKTEDIPLDIIGKIIKKVTLKKFLNSYETVKGKKR